MQHKKLSARILSITLTVAMLFSTIPTTVFATGVDIPGEVQDSGTVDNQPVQEQCSCDVLCAEDKINADCPACSAKDADLANCKGQDEKNTVVKLSYEQVVDLFTALPDASVITRETTEEEMDSIFAQLSKAMDAFDALTTDEQELFLKEKLELYKAAMELNDAITGASPVSLANEFPARKETVKSGETVYYSEIKVGYYIEAGATIINNNTYNKNMKIYMDSNEVFNRTDPTDYTDGPYGESDIAASGRGTLLNKYANTNKLYKPVGIDPTTLSVNTRIEWVVYEVKVVEEISSLAVISMASTDPTVNAEYTATVDTSGLSGATTKSEIVLSQGTKPCVGNNFTVADYDKLKITITPSTNGHLFATPPTVIATNATTVGTVTKVAGSEAYTCEIIGFTGNSTITIAGTAGPATSPPTITTTTLPAAVLGAAYSQTLAATGTAPITWSVTTGSLPVGLTLNASTGEISGTPTAGGAVNFTVTALNGVSPNATKALAITVNEKPVITTATLPDAKVGTAYSQTLAATGTAPITWSVTTGSLPVGLTLNASTGEISGTPTVEGTTNFTVEAANVTGTKVTQALTILVKPAKSTVTITGLAKADATYDGTAKAGYTGTPAYNPSSFTGALEYTYYSGSTATGTPLSGAPINAGTYTVVAAIPAANTDYNGSHTPITFAIAPKSVSVTLGSGQITKEYDGTTGAGTGTIILNTRDIITADSGVTVAVGTIPAYSASTVDSSYSLNVPVALNGNSDNNYTLSNNTVTVPGSITTKTIALADGTLAITKEYDGTTGAGTATGALTATGFVSADSTNVTVSITNIGTYSDANVAQNKTVSLTVELTGSAAGNYSLANTAYSFTKASITKKTPTVTVTAAKKETFSLFGIDLGNKEDTFTITATVSGVGSEKPAGTVQLKANSANLGSVIALSDGVATHEWVQPSATTYTITAEFTPTADTNYANATGTSVQYDINKSDQAALSFTGVPNTVTYGDSKITFATAGGSGSGAVSYVSSHTNVIANDGTIKSVGDAIITATKADDTDYNAAIATITITVNAATPTLAWDTTTQEVTYTGSAPTVTDPKVTLKGSDTFTGTIQYAYKQNGLFSLFTGYTDGLPTDAGEYTIKAHIDATGNCAAADSTNELTLTIKKSTPTVSIKSDYTGKTYDGTAMAAPTEAQLTISGASYANVTFKYSTDSGMTGATATPPTNAGTYYVQASIAEGGNTEAATSATANFTIGKAAATATASANNKVYDGDNTANITLSVATLGSDEVTITVAGATYADKNVGIGKAITVTGTIIAGTAKDNYDVMIPAITGNITAKAVTVTATVATKSYDGSAVATATYTVNGKIGAEDVTASGTATFDNANAGINKTVNTTGITLAGTDSGNYSLGSTSATAQGTINKAAVIVTIDAIGAVDFTGAQIKPTVTVKTTSGNATLAESNYSVTYGTNTDAGTGTVTVTAATGGNYTFDSVSKNFTINKIAYTGTEIAGTKLVVQNTAQARVTFDLNTLTFPAGFKDKSFGAVSYSSNTDGVLTGTPSITGNTLTFGVGSAVKDKSGVIGVVVNSKNYNDYTAKITVTTVDKTTVIISGTAATGLVYNGSAQQGYTAVLVEDNKVSVSELDFTYTGTDKSGASYGPTATAPTKAGDYTLVITVKSSHATYTGTSSDVIFGIGQKELTIKAENQFTYQHKEIPTAELYHDGFIPTEDKTVLGTNAYSAVHTATNTTTPGSNFAIDVSGSTTNKNYLITTMNGTLTIYAVTVPETPKPTPPATTITSPDIVAEPADPANPGDPAKQLRVFSAELAPEEKVETLKQITVPTGGVVTSKEVELQVSSDGGATWTKATLADVKDGKVQVVLPIPTGTSPSTHTYKIHHFANGANASPDSLDPTVSVPTNSLSATVNSLSPFVVVATPKGGGGDHTGGGGSGGGSSSDDGYDFWMNVKEKIQTADDGDVIKANAKDYDKMPASVMDALRKNDDVSLVITWNGKTITIPAGKALKNEAGRIYWPLSLLAEMYANVTEDSVLKPAPQNPETGGPGKFIPVTGGGELITLEALNPVAENTISDGTENTQAVAPIQPKSLTPPDAGFEADAFAGTPDAKTAESKNGVLIPAVAAILAVLCGTGLWFWKKKKEEQ